MANMCTFELRVKGARNAALAVAHSMPNVSAVIRARREAGDVQRLILFQAEQVIGGNPKYAGELHNILS